MRDWQSEIQAEFERAEQARAQHNEGKARVCARRAAGIAAREYFARRGEKVHIPSALDLLNRLAQEPSLSSEIRRSATYLTLRVNEEFKLPVNVDLVTEARKLCNELLK